ncbi:MAG: adenylate/guanylate cyclase domain-containing protein [Rhodocyclaceae bacterium]|nr:adenylate/guanylate cyclase domain-containing protein [Rhodocyclaceae bacterium]
MPWLVGMVVALLLAAVRQVGWLEPLELAAYDSGLRLRPAVPAADVVLILEREEDLHRYGFPLADRLMSDLIERLESQGAAVVGIDKYRDVPVPPGQEQLAATIARHANVVWIFKFSGEHEVGIGPPPAVRNPQQLGFNDVVRDGDGIVRRAPLFLDDGRSTSQSAALSLAMLYLKGRGIVPAGDPANPDAMVLGKLTLKPFEGTDGGYSVADAAGFQTLIDYRAGAAGFKSYSLEDAFQDRIPTAALQGKIVLFGSVAESFKDFFDTPIQSFGQSGRATFGVEVHAHIASQLVRGALGQAAPLRWLPDWAEYAAILLCSLLGGWVGHWLRRPATLGLAVGGGAAVLVATSLAGFLAGWWLALIPAALGYVLGSGSGIVWRAFAEHQERKTVMRLFSRYVSKEVAEEIWAQRSQFMSDGKPKPRLVTATVLFSDVAGFTSVSEKMAPEALFAWLDAYMSAMTQAIIDNGGVINKYIGDAVMALYGVPVVRSTPDGIAADALAAVKSAMQMGAALDKINRDGAAAGNPEIRMRIGICTGPLAAGTIGMGDRLEFTVLGDTVNVASRLESLKTVETTGSCRVLVSAETFRLVADHYRGKPVGEVALKGRDQQVAVFEILDNSDETGRTA